MEDLVIVAPIVMIVFIRVTSKDNKYKYIYTIHYLFHSFIAT